MIFHVVKQVRQYQLGRLGKKISYGNTIADFLSHRKCIAQKCNLSRISRVLPNLLDDIGRGKGGTRVVG